jgi:NADH dehydrogenase
VTGISARPVIITGATGFIGRRVMARLAREAGTLDLLALTRQPDALRSAGWWPAHWRTATQDLRDKPETAGWPGHATVLHLAAATGNASRRTMESSIVDGTRSLLDAAQAAKAAHFVLVSSIAAGYRDTRWYHYAKAKLAAEQIVSESDVPWTIVRPTLVFGAGSPVEKALWGLACGRLPVVPGGGRVRMQPVDVDDVAETLMGLMHTGPLGTVVELGGVEAVTLRELLARMRAIRGLPPREPVGVPLGALRTALGLVEPVFGGFLPVTAGQLAAFVNDSDVDQPLPQSLRTRVPPFASIGAMLRPEGARG